jgi:phospholipid/cholesterol/gamma-HCH transport system substrate-binding protein
VPVTLASDRAGLVMESGAKVKMRGVEVGRVASIIGGKQPVNLKLEIYPDQISHIPANVQAEIKATTAFGAKYVELIAPDDPSPKRLAAGAVLNSRNVATEVNTVFQNLVGLLDQIDVTKLNATLTAVADGVRGQGQRIGEATSDANQVLLAVNPRMDTVAANWRSFKGFSDAYSAAAQDIMATLNAASTTSTTIARQAAGLDALLLNTAGFSNSAINLLAPNKDNLVQAINELEPTTNLLLKYNPEYTCLLVGAKFHLDHGGYENFGGNGRTIVVDSAVLMGSDPYKFPDNLPIVGAKGGPGGTPGCGSLPDVSKNFPVRYLVTNTGWGTGMDMRPNPGIGFPGWANYFPVTRGVPEPPSIRNIPGGPAPGPIPYPGAPPYGAPLYGPDGTPLYPGLPPAPPPSAPREPGGSPGEEPFSVDAPAAVQPTPLPPPPAPAEGFQPGP